MSIAEDIQFITMAGRFLVSELLIMVRRNRQSTSIRFIIYLRAVVRFPILQQPAVAT